MTAVVFNGIRFQRNGRLLADLVDSDSLLAYVSAASFDVVVAERAAPGVQSEIPTRDDDGESAQAALVSDGLYAFEVLHTGDDYETTMLTSPGEVVGACIAWGENAPGWRDAYTWQ